MLWYSFVVQSPPPPKGPRGGTGLTKGGRLQGGGGVMHQFWHHVEGALWIAPQGRGGGESGNSGLSLRDIVLPAFVTVSHGHVGPMNTSVPCV